MKLAPLILLSLLLALPVAADPKDSTDPIKDQAVCLTGDPLCSDLTAKPTKPTKPKPPKPPKHAAVSERSEKRILDRPIGSAELSPHRSGVAL
jgi:hypothetical protein